MENASLTYREFRRVYAASRLVNVDDYALVRLQDLLVERLTNKWPTLACKIAGLDNEQMRMLRDYIRQAQAADGQHSGG